MTRPVLNGDGLVKRVGGGVAVGVAVVLLMPRGVLGLLQQKYHLPRTI